MILMSEVQEVLEEYRSMGWVGGEMMTHLVNCMEEDERPDPDELTTQGVEWIADYTENFLTIFAPGPAQRFLAWISEHFTDEYELKESE